MSILELRTYQRAKHALDTAKKPGDVDGYPGMEMVGEVMTELVRRHKERHG